ncbi:MAG TPA: hypothetical protein VE441_14675, partial [Mycobacterium sp.]|nr:hypothetical protein [Mycobacterium sp.]
MELIGRGLNRAVVPFVKQRGRVCKQVKVSLEVTVQLVADATKAIPTATPIEREPLKWRRASRTESRRRVHDDSEESNDASRAIEKCSGFGRHGGTGDRGS